ncbi:glycoside hydrolase family 61 protein [Botryobasidium botryosum FD-172 SS1]|uniref:lytic cellulose monooxygenase (C4-dehydrogenating) n=1 Tax=Botryobasidium botryosum (strain FD-172 SS1) TaxID=930990 RepID=A0A067N827_BOTB1|nr:glycoside hydrolase family 61 protein [Botryobasidium botryosum FD-172 SS1]
MKFLSAVILAVAAAQQAAAHYRFLSLNGSPEYQYIRVPDNQYSNGPVTSVSSTDIRCNLGAAARTTGTLTTAAGSSVTFAIPNGISHPGPLLVYLARAPGSVNGWDASGNVWFKINQVAPTFSAGAINWPASANFNRSIGISSYSVKIPASLPAAEYLLRIEHIALHSAGSSGGSQHYISCAQLKVTGGGNASPGPLVAFPGAYKATDPGILFNLYYPVPTSYVMPGPSVWQG